MRVPHAVLLAVLAALAAGCDREATERASAQAGAKTREALAETREALSEAREKLPPKLEAAGDRLADAGSKVVETVKETVKVDRDGVAVTGGPGTPTTTTVRTGPETAVAGVPARTREAVSDAAVTASVKAGLVKEPGLSALRIDVDTRDGVVTLNGVADSDEARKRAGELARSTRGVREVRNHLTVKQG